MNRFFAARRRMAGLASVLVVGAAVAASGAAPAGAENSFAVATCPGGPPVLQLGNPNPGDILSQGDYNFSGVAFDPGATDGSGIAHVDLFLGSRDSGGIFVASTTPGQGSNSSRVFEVKGTIPSTATGGRDFVAYAYSSVDSQVTTVTVPVFVGAAPTPTPTGGTAPTPVPLTETTSSSCQGSAAVAVAPAAPATVSATSQPQAATTEQTGPVLSLANPSAGDLLSTGDVIIEGTAFDPSATDGAGIDRIDLFLDSRGSGGTSLGTGTPEANHTFRIKASVPSNASGGHTFYVYARSSVTGQEAVASVPVFVGVAPTPTPRPK
jgi:hypothetical protein